MVSGSLSRVDSGRREGSGKFANLLNVALSAESTTREDGAGDETRTRDSLLGSKREGEMALILPFSDSTSYLRQTSERS